MLCLLIEFAAYCVNFINPHIRIRFGKNCKNIPILSFIYIGNSPFPLLVSITFHLNVHTTTLVPCSFIWRYRWWKINRHFHEPYFGKENHDWLQTIAMPCGICISILKWKNVSVTWWWFVKANYAASNLSFNKAKLFYSHPCTYILHSWRNVVTDPRAKHCEVK